VDIEQAKEIVITVINDALESKVDISYEMQLIGGDSLVELVKL